MPRRKLSDEAARLRAAFGYSCDGLKWACGQPAFRAELALCAVGVPLALAFGKSGLERAVLLATLLGVLAVELLNSGIEAAIDRISTERHPLSKAAKDAGSAAVLVWLCITGVVWLLVIMG